MTLRTHRVTVTWPLLPTWHWPVWIVTQAEPWRKKVLCKATFILQSNILHIFTVIWQRKYFQMNNLPVLDSHMAEEVFPEGSVWAWSKPERWKVLVFSMMIDNGGSNLTFAFLALETILRIYYFNIELIYCSGIIHWHPRAPSKPKTQSAQAASKLPLFRLQNLLVLVLDCLLISFISSSLLRSGIHVKRPLILR